MVLDTALNQAEANSKLNKPCKNFASIFERELPFMQHIDNDLSRTSYNSSSNNVTKLIQV
jgi:hypothetical protein